MGHPVYILEKASLKPVVDAIKIVTWIIVLINVRRVCLKYLLHCEYPTIILYTISLFIQVSSILTFSV